MFEEDIQLILDILFLEAGPSPAVSDINIEAIDDDSLFINWTSSGLCIDNYTVTIN